MQARYYDSNIGRFLNVDPAFRELSFSLEDPQSMNSYAYARNTPITHLDPDGNIPVIAALAIPAILAGATAMAPMAGYFVSNPAQSAQLVTRVAPGSGEAIDLAEAIGGRDIYSGQSLSVGERAVTLGAFALPIVPGKWARQGLNAVNDVARSLDVVRASSRYGWADPRTLQGHSVRHAQDFGLSGDDYTGYARKANEYIAHKQYTNIFKEGGDTVYWNADTNIAVYTNRDQKIISAYEVKNQNKIDSYRARAAKQQQ